MNGRPARVKLCVRVCEQYDARVGRGVRRMHVLSPASSSHVLVSASNAAPHRAAVFLYLAEHNGGIGTVELFDRTDSPKLEAAGLGPVWHFVVDLELRDA